MTTYAATSAHNFPNPYPSSGRVLDVGLIAAKAVLALAMGHATGAAAMSESSGSALLGLVVNGVSYGDATPPPNTRLELPSRGTPCSTSRRRPATGSTAPV